MENILFHNGPIVTMAAGEDGASAGPEAVLVSGDRIAMLGSLEDVRRAADRQDGDVKDIDLNGRALLPGFIDGHMHPLPMIFFALAADLDGAATCDDIRSRLQAQRARLAADEWLIAVQFENNKLPDGDVLSAAVLDQWFPDIPVLIYARDGHSIVVNSLVLGLIDLDRPDPDGGTIGRNVDGSPSGYFYEKALGLVQAVAARPDRARFVAQGQKVFDDLARCGITSVGIMLQSDEEGPGGAGSKGESQIMAALRDTIPQSVYAIIIGKTMQGIEAALQSALNDPQGASSVRAFKIFADGTFGSCTACMAEAYADKPCTHGYMTLPEDEIYRRMETAHMAGYQVCIHAIGDQGIANCVGMFERLLEEHPRDHRHRIEHASIADQKLIARIAKLGLHICTQPLFIRSEMDWLPKRLGAERARHAYPFRDYIDAGITLAASSDAPIEDTSVIAGMDFAVNRGGFHPHQGVSVAEALAMYTRDAARLEFSEHEKGSIEVGKLADLVILDRNPLDGDPADIGSLIVEATMIRGVMVHDIRQSGSISA